jgi:signal transduction histidine kinase
LLTAAARKDGAFASVSVKDTGVGISLDDQEKLFQPFSQVGKNASTSQAGTGLGLHICKGLVEKRDG